MMPDGMPLFHWVLLLPSSERAVEEDEEGIETIRLLADVLPEAVHTRDQAGDLPIHQAVRSGNTEYVRFLVRRNVDSVRAKGQKGRLPVHVAMEGQNLDMVQYVHNFWPDLLYETDDSGMNAMHMAVADPIRLGGETLKKVEFLLSVAPGMVGAADRAGRRPLHAAVDQEFMLTNDEKTDELVSVVRLLIDRHPVALAHQDSNGNLPLHVAARSYAPAPILRLLLEHNLEALRARNRQGLLPVHLALHRERSEVLRVQLLLCSSMSDCYMEHEIESVHFLVELWPESIQEADARGRNLVHRAFDGPATPGHRVAWSLLQKQPDAALVRDHQGLLLIHAAAAADAPLDLLYSMMQLQQKLLRERAGRRREQPMLTNAASALGPASSKRPRMGDPQD
jgi:ankyrin repeat protein